MGDDKLKQSLERLNKELKDAQQADPALRDLIHPLQRDVEAALASDQPPHRYHGLRERLADAVARLEQSHPNLALAIGSVLDHLANV